MHSLLIFPFELLVDLLVWWGRVEEAALKLAVKPPTVQLSSLF
jgi:hypothetical protein